MSNSHVDSSSGKTVVCCVYNFYCLLAEHPSIARFPFRKNSTSFLTEFWSINYSLCGSSGVCPFMSWYFGFINNLKKCIYI